MRDNAGYVSRVDRLRDDVSASAVVTPDGEWHDIHDFGYRMMNDTDANADAQERWNKHFRRLLEEHPNCWAIERWAHS